LFRVFLACLFFVFGVNVGSTSAQELIDPGWNDPVFAKYLSALEHRSDADRNAITMGLVDSDGSQVAFTLPVLGFSAVEREDADRSGLDGAPFNPAALGEGIPDWPGCANQAPKITTVPFEPADVSGAPEGSWYVRSFDYDCMEVTLEGDQNPLPDSFAQLVMKDSGTIEVNWFDENDGIYQDGTGRELGASAVEESVIPRGVPTVSIYLGNLIYGMEVYCVEPSTIPFCNNGEAIRALAARLSVVGGQP
jgi:hypothetical protein